MPNDKRCKKCNKTIDEGELCPACQIKPIFKERLTSSELKEMHRQGDIMRLDMRDKMKDFMKNETMQPPMPWSKD